MIQAETGLAEVTGTAESGPSHVGVSISDITTGLSAYAQILEALFRRVTTGTGSDISVALFDVTAEIMNIPYIAVRNGGGGWLVMPTSRSKSAAPVPCPARNFPTETYGSPSLIYSTPSGSTGVCGARTGRAQSPS
jgi:crotonobetainyl-CoA:carnitine CoA-transferase CaiB-like acyl-CoA transferase